MLKKKSPWCGNTRGITQESAILEDCAPILTYRRHIFNEKKEN